MMKTARKILAMLLPIVLLMTICCEAAAAGSKKFLHSYYEAEGDTLIVLSDKLSADGNIEASIEADKDLPTTVSIVSEEKMKTTVYCVVDTSYETQRKIFDREIEILKIINGLMTEGDEMVICVANDKITETEALKTTEARNKAIDKLEHKGNKTDLLGAVNLAVESLGKNGAYNQNKCIVILAPGTDDGLSGLKEQTVRQTIEESTIPVYGVAVMTDYPENFEKNAAKSVENMANSSIGGKHYNTSKDGTQPMDVATDIWTTIQAATVIKIDVSGVSAANMGDSALLTVRYSGGSTQMDDFISVAVSDLPGTEADEDEEEEDEGGLPIAVIIGIAAAVVVIIAVIAVVIAKKKKAAEPDIPDFQDIPDRSPVDDDMGTIPPSIDTIDPFATVPVEPVAIKTEPVPETLPVKLTVLGHGDMTFRFELIEDKSTIVGREASRADVVLSIGGAKDTKLSAAHCELIWTDGKILVKDKNSTNGTYVNGSAVLPGSLQQIIDNDTLSIGSYEYRVSVGKKL